MPAGPGFDRFTRWIVGSQAERKSQEIQLRKQYEGVDEWLGSIKTAQPERFQQPCSSAEPNSSAPARRVAPGSHITPETVPLPPRCQPRRIPGLEILGHGQTPASTLDSVEGELFPGSRPPTMEFIDRCYQSPNREPKPFRQRAGKVTEIDRGRYFDEDMMVRLPVLSGVGRFRKDVDADEQHQKEILDKTLSYMDTRTVQQWDLDFSGLDKQVVEKYKGKYLKSPSVFENRDNHHHYQHHHHAYAKRHPTSGGGPGLSDDELGDVPVSGGGLYSSASSTHDTGSRAAGSHAGGRGGRDSPLTTYASSVQAPPPAPGTCANKSKYFPAPTPPASASAHVPSGAAVFAGRKPKAGRRRGRRVHFDDEDTECAVISDDE